MKQYPAGYWAGVLGTAMFMLGLFGLGISATLLTLSDALVSLSKELHENQVGMAFGHMVKGMTLGVMSISGVETGDAARKLLDLMPSPNFLEVVGAVRGILSILAVIIGFCLVRRHHWAILAGLIWSLFSVGWFCYTSAVSWKFLLASLGNPLDGGNTPLYIVDFLIHIIWPILLCCWLLPSLLKGRERRWVLPGE